MSRATGGYECKRPGVCPAASRLGRERGSDAGEVEIRGLVQGTHPFCPFGPRYGRAEIPAP